MSAGEGRPALGLRVVGQVGDGPFGEDRLQPGGALRRPPPWIDRGPPLSRRSVRFGQQRPGGADGTRTVRTEPGECPEGRTVGKCRLPVHGFAPPILSARTAPDCFPYFASVCRTNVASLSDVAVGPECWARHRRPAAACRPGLASSACWTAS